MIIEVAIATASVTACSANAETASTAPPVLTSTASKLESPTVVTVTSTAEVTNSPEPPGDELRPITVNVDGVVDGDTLDALDASGKSLRVRLIGSTRRKKLTAKAAYAKMNLSSMLANAARADTIHRNRSAIDDGIEPGGCRKTIKRRNDSRNNLHTR